MDNHCLLTARVPGDDGDAEDSEDKDSEKRKHRSLVFSQRHPKLADGSPSRPPANRLREQLGLFHLLVRKIRGERGTVNAPSPFLVVTSAERRVTEHEPCESSRMIFFDFLFVQQRNVPTACSRARGGRGSNSRPHITRRFIGYRARYKHWYP